MTPDMSINLAMPELVKCDHVMPELIISLAIEQKRRFDLARMKRQHKRELNKKRIAEQKEEDEQMRQSYEDDSDFDSWYQMNMD